MLAVEQWCVREGARGAVRSRGLMRLAWREVLRLGVLLFRMRTGVW